MLLCANATATARSIEALNDTFCELDGARMRTDAWSSRLVELTEFLPEGACRNSSLDEHYSPIFGEGLEARAPPLGEQTAVGKATAMATSTASARSKAPPKAPPRPCGKRRVWAPHP